jgi:hypothetical protein
MPKVTINGATLNFPDGTTPEQIDQGVEDYLASKASEAPSAAQAAPDLADQAAQAAGYTKQEVQNMIPNINKVDPSMESPFLPKSVIDVVNNAADTQNPINQARRESATFLQGVKQASDQGSLMNMLKSAGHEAYGFLTGGEDLLDKYAPEAISKALNYRIGGNLPFNTTSAERMAARKAEMEQANADQTYRSIASPVSSTVGSAVPYLLSERALSPITGAILDTVGRGAALAGSGAVSLAGRAAPLEASANPLLAATGRGAQNLVDYGAHVANRPVMSPAFRQTTRELARAPLTGAAEGSLQYNQTAGQGAFSSSLGQAMGTFSPLPKYLGKAERRVSDSEKQIMDRMSKEGYRFTPGMWTGDKVLQAREKGFRSEAQFRNYMNEFDQANDKVIANQASDAMGLPRQATVDLTPETLTNHMANLRNQYTALEASTRGVIGRDQARTMGDALKDLQPTSSRNTSAADRARYEQVRSVVQQIQKETDPISRPGSRTVYGFDGAKYQQLRQRVQDEASQAFQNGDRRLGNSLKKVQQALDDSLRNGMSSTSAKQWKDLNERYAMSNLVMNNGMNPLGGIDTGKLTKTMMSGDEAVRTLTSKGGRIKKLQDIARMDELNRRQAGAEGWSGSGVAGAEPEKMGLLKSIVHAPIASAIPTSTRAGMNLYMSGYPVTRGLLGGVSQEGVRKGIRANEQGSQTVAEVGKSIGHGYRNAVDYLEELNKAIRGEQ